MGHTNTRTQARPSRGRNGQGRQARGRTTGGYNSHQATLQYDTVEPPTVRTTQYNGEIGKHPGHHSNLYNIYKKIALCPIHLLTTWIPIKHKSVARYKTGPPESQTQLTTASVYTGTAATNQRIEHMDPGPTTTDPEDGTKGKEDPMLPDCISVLILLAAVLVVIHARCSSLDQRLGETPITKGAPTSAGQIKPRHLKRDIGHMHNHATTQPNQYPNHGFGSSPGNTLWQTPVYSSYTIKQPSRHKTGPKTHSIKASGTHHPPTSIQHSSSEDDTPQDGLPPQYIGGYSLNTPTAQESNAPQSGFYKETQYQRFCQIHALNALFGVNI